MFASNVLRRHYSYPKVYLLNTTTMKKYSIIFLTMISLSLGSLKAGDIKVLLVFPEKYGANSFLMLEKLEEFGWDVTTTGVNPVIQPCYWGNEVTVDTLISDITDISNYDCLILCTMRWYSNPPNAYSDILNSTEALQLFTAANNAGLIIYAACAGVRVLAAADILNGVNITGNDYYESEYLAAGANFLGINIPPVIDGNIVTAMRGQYYFNQNMEAVKTALENKIN